MRFSVKTGAPLLALALALSACGTSGGDDEEASSGGGEAGTCEDVAIGYFGALTGAAANLGINIRNGVQLAVDQFNEENADCQVSLEEYDSAGDPNQATGLATQAIGDDSVIGIVGPAFSGESDTAGPIFAEGGLPTISASATNPDLSQNGWDTFHRVLGNDASQGPAAATYIADVIKSEKVFVVDDASAYGAGLAEIVEESAGDAVVGTDTIQTGQTDFSATVTAIRSSGADSVFFGGYYAEAGLLVQQMRAAGVEATFVVADGVKDPGFIEAAGDAAEGTIITCPCLPPEEEQEFYAAFEEAFGAAPATYSAEAFDAANVMLEGILEGNTDRESLLEWINDYSGEGITKTITFDEDGEPENISVWAYKVENGEIVADQEIETN
ncbi:amino acid/amide ABC transporter substrate-binding protein, HAAT family [Blastococcus aggregatus]|uniref:Amino acid/amide ABC transporter substrate-binding protein, HAAT family n=1 Tax=Blastococcus aggregatus TaxID=38502 RepID=A0A285VAN2_9ACTN|nr:branched-chain amino acid ABC transporter substrate-binding protein [Blastococcus aggregatus]SOC50638.1 amino acid/amide ABC transporter substrate-binding protein, HAAT family [Blastococcus aggregatus]